MFCNCKSKLSSLCGFCAEFAVTFSPDVELGSFVKHFHSYVSHASSFFEQSDFEVNLQSHSLLGRFTAILNVFLSWIFFFNHFIIMDCKLFGNNVSEIGGRQHLLRQDHCWCLSCLALCWMLQTSTPPQHLLLQRSAHLPMTIFGFLSSKTLMQTGFVK